ncbi:MAG: hypothetical protein AB7J13_06570 [Pyrinomonadaceae bacterium]
MLILSGCRLGASLAAMSGLIGINASIVSRRYDTAKRRLPKDRHISEAVENVIKQYEVYRA